jgi:hypothetical protein
MNAAQWSPKHIEIEPAFDSFVPTFRNGRLIRELMADPSKLPLNADYLFPGDNIVAELKCLVKNPLESTDWPPRLARAFMSTGHSFDDLEGFLFRGEKMPDRVVAKLFGWLRDSVRSVVKRANRQIRASKRGLGNADTNGLLLIANDNHYGFAPDAMLEIIGDAAACLTDSHIDALVYFTPNVFHRKAGSDVAWVLWEPRYRSESDSLAEFINDMGRRWNDYSVTITGDPFVEREEKEFTDAALMRPVRRLGRH